ncbi:MAG: GNAT family N-acetyltransferase [Fibrobacteres bacterium]|nr:GNAT family N-acetyltransferase [Fibrobacterota bacterium]
MSNYKLRECIPEKNPNDMEQLLSAYLTIWNAPENIKFLSLTGKPFTEPQVREWFSKHLSSVVKYLIAEEASTDKIFGILVMSLSNLNGVNIGGVGVLPEYKGKGIGKKLIQESIAVAQKEGFKAIGTQVYANNFRMLKLLLSLEFMPVRMEHNMGFDGTDFVHFKKYLQ